MQLQPHPTINKPPLIKTASTPELLTFVQHSGEHLWVEHYAAAIGIQVI